MQVNSDNLYRLITFTICILLTTHIVPIGISNQETDTRSVIIDSDGAPDDVYAILYLLKHPGITVQALTLSCGVSYVSEGANNFAQLMSFLGYDDIPVAAGKSTPLNVNHTFPTPWRDGSKNFYGLNLPSTEKQVSNLSASELIITLVNSSPEKITIIALGPLTNVALAIQSDPSIKDKIELVDIMGGAVNVPGNVGYESEIPNYEAEWNFYIDPHAVDIVFRSELPILLVPLDATNLVPITEEFKEKLGQEKITTEADIIHQLLSPGLYFWDILAAVALTDRNIVTIQEYHLEVVIDEENHEGETIPIDGQAFNVQVATDANQTAFEMKFLEIINPITTTTEFIPSTTTTTTVARSTYFGVEAILAVFSVLFIRRRRNS
ncbi:MAG: nucleoside hydrolase [Candidatus Hodarchaeales archaeon]|jgi:pyrimidine-specific ribonucleoside hydrolase